jgi:glycosyltransferase involved in cell wall biosynthesis
VAIVAGRLVAWKGVALAIRALALLPDWQLEILGTGPDEGRLRALVQQLGLAERVEFVPMVSQEELWRRMRLSAVVIVPSVRDAAPLTIAEAASLGLAVVALDQGGSRVLARTDGDLIRLVPRAGVDQTIKGIAEAVLASRSTYVSSDFFGGERIADDLAGMYRTAVESRQTANQLFAAR